MDVSGVTDGTADVQDPFQPLRDRGVSEAVWQARGYIPYYGRRHPLYDPSAIHLELNRYPTMAKGQRDTLLNFASGAPDAAPPRDTFLRFAREKPPARSSRADDHEGRGRGLLMHKFPVHGQPAVLPQLRPEYPVRTGGTTWHRHDEDFLDNHKGLDRHIADAHNGNRSFPEDRMHEHEDFAKYLLAPLEKGDVFHVHADVAAFQGQKGRAKLRQHIRARTGHRGERIDPTARHKHRRDVRGQHVADRLDIHPWAADRLLEAERVYFVIEGTPKADAVLTKIIETNANASVFDVPSVTLWKAPELEWFAPARLGRPVFGPRKLVVVVPDADWFENPAVLRQALLCREFLRGCGVIACIGAPPQSSGCKGIDDFLVSGGELDDLDILDREARFSLALYAAGPKREASDPDEGTIRGGPMSLARVLGVKKNADSVVHALQNHIAQGLITADRDLELGVNEWTGDVGWTGAVAEWPKFTIAHSYRYTQEFARLGDYEPTLPPERPADILTKEYQLAFAIKSLLAYLRTVGDATGAQPGPVLPGFTAIIKATAARMNVKHDTVRDAHYTRELRKIHDGIRADIVRHYLLEGRPYKEAADALSVSVSTVRRIEKQLRAKEQGMLQHTGEGIAEDVARQAQINAMQARTNARQAEINAAQADIIGRLALRDPGPEDVTETIEKFIASATASKPDLGGIKGT